MKSKCSIHAVHGSEGTQIDVSGSGRDLCCALVSIMVAFLRKGLIDPHGLFLLVSSAVLVASDE